MLRFHCVLGALVFTLMACSESPTGVMLRIDAEALTKAELRSVRVRIHRQDGDTWTETFDERVAGNDVQSWPIEIPVVPDGDSGRIFDVQVEALDGDDALITRAYVVTRYVKGVISSVPVLLEDSCRDVMCGSPADCHGEGCEYCRAGGCQTATLISPISYNPSHSVLTDLVSFFGDPDGGIIDTSDAGGMVSDAGVDPPVDCGPPAAPSRGAVDASDTTLGAGATYRCDDGYELRGDRERSCVSNGSWSGRAPTCMLLDCGAPPAPANGSVAAAQTTFGSTATHTCNSGYNLGGDRVRTCDDSGTWSGGAPTCTIVDCGPPAVPADGSVSNDNTTYGAMVDYGCDSGYGLVGEPASVCQADGSWDGTLPQCVLGSCGSLPAVVDGSFMSNGTSFGAVATYACDSGFLLNGDVMRSCLADLTWSGSAPTCAPRDCGPLGAPVNGSISNNGTTFGSTASYSCNTGYTRNGSASRTCQADGSWSASAPTCQIVDCGGLGDPNNGSVNDSVTTYGATASYSCNTGYTRNGSASRTCQADGSWSASAPTCQIVDCGGLSDPNNGSVNDSVTTYGATASYSCDVGYYVNGLTTRTCDASGDWSGSAPTCADACLDDLRMTQLHVGTQEFVRIENTGNCTAILQGVRVLFRDSDGMDYMYDFGPASLGPGANATIGEGGATYTFGLNLAGTRSGAIALCAASPCSSSNVLDAFTFDGGPPAPALPTGVTVNGPVFGMATVNEFVEDFRRYAYNGSAPNFTSCDWAVAREHPLFSETFECGTAGWGNLGNPVSVDGGSPSPDGSPNSLVQTGGGIAPAEGFYFDFPASIFPTHIDYFVQTSRVFIFADTARTQSIVATLYQDWVGNLCLYGAGAVCLDTPDNSWSRVALENIDWAAGTADFYVNGNLVGTDQAFGSSYNANTGMRQINLTAGGRWDNIRMW